MQRREYPRRVGGSDELAPRHRHAELRAEQRLGGGRTEAADHRRLDRRNLGVEPRAAGLDFALRGCLVQATLAARLPLEVLHRVGDVERRAVDAGGLERAVEKAPGGTDERQAAPVFLVAGLLADEHRTGMGRAGAEYGLRRARPQRAVAASCRRLTKLLQRLRHRSLESQT
jgi:hypothetical protein